MDTITDDQGIVVATVEVSEYAPGRFEGVVLSANFPEGLTSLLREYESLVNDQVFSSVDEVERKLKAYPLFLAERNAPIDELQLWGSTGIHFWTVAQLPQTGAVNAPETKAVSLQFA